MCISVHANTFDKGTNPSLLLYLTTLGKLLGRLDSLALARQPVLEKENSEFKPAVLHLKIDLELYPTHGNGVVLSYVVTKAKMISNLIYWNTQERLSLRTRFATTLQFILGEVNSCLFLKHQCKVNTNCLTHSKNALCWFYFLCHESLVSLFTATNNYNYWISDWKYQIILKTQDDIYLIE